MSDATTTAAPAPRPLSCAQALREAGAIAVPRAVGVRTCAGLIRNLQAMPAAVTRPISPQTMEREHDPAFVRSKTVAASPAAHALVERVLSRQLPRLQEFFERPLELNAELHFLTYEAGGFIRPHCDVLEGEGVLEKIRERVVVFTLFLNGADGPPAHAFAGGDFVLYPSADRRLVLPCAPGLLVAFRADVVHSVRAVTAGTRHAVSGWFRDPAS